MESILTSIKKLLGISEDDESFDTDIITHINSVFMILNQLGVGPTRGFRIYNKEDIWDDYITDEVTAELVKSYIYLKVRILFDPPSTSAVMESINRQISEFEWRLNISSDSKVTS